MLSRTRAAAWIVPVFALAVVSWGGVAHAADKAACAAAAEAGQRLFKEHKLTAAREKLLFCSNTECPDIISKDCTQWLGEVERTVASVVVRMRDEQGQPINDVKVSVDGAVLTEHAADAPVELDPGNHVFRFEHAGFDPVEQNVAVAEGKRGQEIAGVMHPPKPAGGGGGGAGEGGGAETKSSGGGFLVSSIVFAGVGVVGMGLFTGFALAGIAQQNDLKKSCAPNCTPTDLAPLNTKFTIANASLVAGLVGIGVGAALFIVWAVTHHSGDKVSLRDGLVVTF